MDEGGKNLETSCLVVHDLDTRLPTHLLKMANSEKMMVFLLVALWILLYAIIAR